MNKIYLTIDFEDFSHDIKRDLGIWKTGELREKQLWESFEKIENFKERQKIKGITYFITGIIAKRIPNLVKNIALAGNEIACHYYFHDSVHLEKTTEFEKNLILAKESLEIASQTTVQGFRAPKFSLSHKDLDKLEIISKYFYYDSSLTIQEFEKNKKVFKMIDLKFIPLSTGEIFGKNIQVGGSFLKFIPLQIHKNILKYCDLNNYKKQIYLHPYEFLLNEDFKMSYNEIEINNLWKRLYWFYRQNQWHHPIGNRVLMKKVSRITANNIWGGRLIDKI